MRFSKRKLHFFSFFYFGEIETEKRKKENGKRPKNPIKIVFLRWSSKNVKNQKIDFWQKLPGTICVRQGDVHTICFGQIRFHQNSVNEETL